MGRGKTAKTEPISNLDIESQPADGLSQAEKDLADYLVKSGILPEEGVKKSSAADLQRRRQRYFENVGALMENYRHFRHIHITLKECLADTLAAKTGMDDETVQKAGGVFSALASSLDIMAAKDEDKFNRIYAPQIQTGRKYEMALAAADFGLNFLKREDPEGYNILYLLYVEGDTRPVMADVLPKTQYSSQASLYRKKADALQKMSQAIFGFYPGDRQALYSTLVFLRQCNIDPNFADPV